MKKCSELLKKGYDKCPPLEHGYPEDDCIYYDILTGECLKYHEKIKKVKLDEQKRSI